jgi:hypothetical protein
LLASHIGVSEDREKGGRVKEGTSEERTKAGVRMPKSEGRMTDAERYHGDEVKKRRKRGVEVRGGRWFVVTAED